MTPATTLDNRLAAIRERTLWAQSSTDGLVAQMARDLDYLLARLDAAEAAAAMGSAFLRESAPFLRESFARSSTAPAREALRAALAAWFDSR